MNFEAEVPKSDVPVLVDFTATWCGPCKALAPIIDKVADEFQGKVKVGKVDIDERRPDDARQAGRPPRRLTRRSQPRRPRRPPG
jgi:thioredoxin 1